MNIFILNSGRCGSTTWIKACQHISNYTAAHESRVHCVGNDRIAYPPYHIEADNRLCWFLGRLDQKYGDNALYVHLTRDRQDTAQSFFKRQDFGIMQAYKEGILMGTDETVSAYDLALDYLDTIQTNISLFLKDKSRKTSVSLESAKTDFPEFWKSVGAKGSLKKALLEFDIHYNSSSE